MATTAGAVGSVATAHSRPAAAARPAGATWTVWCGVLAVTSATIGGAWDVAWHRSIGRDSFWTPAHMMVYACGLLAAAVCGYLIVATTFGRSREMRDVSVKVLGFRAPLGAFVAAWGGIAMLVSAPFDDWWHAAYGLDVKIVSPPHALLLLGARAVSIGVLFLIAAAMNRAARIGGESYRTLLTLFLYLGGMMVAGQMFFLMEFTGDVLLHGAGAYVAISIAVPVVLATFWESSGFRWTATATALLYMLICLAEVLIFPLFPATPKLGPVYVAVTHLVPPKFPILLVAPALALDLLWQRTRGWKTWQLAAVSGVVFVAVLVAVEWPFANFLLSKASENRFFGTTEFSYWARPESPDRMRQFVRVMSGPALARGLMRAMAWASGGTWVGMHFGRWMRTVER